jgi:transcriptional regulator with XRE-family HTH domain
MTAQSQLRNNLLALLQEHELNQSELARRCGIQAKTINRLLAPDEEAHSPTLETLESVASALDLTVAELLSPQFKAGAPRPAQIKAQPQTLGVKVGALVEAFIACDERDQRSVLKLAEALASSRHTGQ